MQHKGIKILRKTGKIFFWVILGLLFLPMLLSALLLHELITVMTVIGAVLVLGSAVMGELPEAMLMNVRTGERWRVRVPDRQRFLDAVTTCVTKQAYQTWRDQ